MGAVASNVAKEVSKVTNTISQSTNANTEQVSEIANKFSINSCDIELSGDFNVNQVAHTNTTSTQINTASQSTTLNNTIAQKLHQAASATVKNYGLGFSDAHNSASSIANCSNDVRNSMETSSSAFAGTSQDFNCANSTIVAKNFTATQTSSSDMIANQTNSNMQTSDIVNNITQSITQKAVAKVAGFSLGIILAILLCIIAAGIILPLTGSSKATGSMMKASIVSAVLFSVFMVLSILFGEGIGMWPWYHNDPECTYFDDMSCTSECVDPFKMEKSLYLTRYKSVRVKNAPLRYQTKLLPVS
jgi:hypothetical protein